MLTQSIADTTAGRVSVSIDLPRWGYLKPIFQGLRAEVVRTIENDWTTLERDTAAEIKRLTEQRDKITEELKTRSDDLRRRTETAERAERKAQELREELASIVSQIKRL